MDSTTVRPKKARLSPRGTPSAGRCQATLDLWLCFHAAGPRDVIPHILRQLSARGGCPDEMVEAISQAASQWTRAAAYLPSR